MPKLTMVEAIRQALEQEMERDNRVIVLGEDVGVNGGVFRATEGLQSQFGENRVFDTPLAESGIIGSSVGLAINGLRPVAEIQFLGFIYETMDQICAQAARMRFRTGGKYTVPMVIRSPFSGNVRSPELHSDSLEALFLHTPGLKVVIPSNPYDAKGLLISAIRDEDPVLFFEPMKLYRAFRAEVPEESYEVPIGKAAVIKEGEDATIVTYGGTVPMVKKVAEEFQAKGVCLEVIDLRTISPLDIDTINESVEKTGRLMIVHEAVKTGGVGAEIIALISEETLYSLAAPVVRVTGYDTPYPVQTVEDDWLPNEHRVKSGVEKLLAY
ncbi:pyruvate dehydrogenase E1 component beta subunit [Neobacillus niacini]|uniref:alpha-ketoacid dehydrogenase subunit beta n=1 Tax=Neobacillus niacini TaxID=86668 RepID=UPI002787B81C|nr:alpha-ketoacid dehydrogenase subunit beta [Neobacillus niacini]MDQ1002911.1 pyruvate dehydrogenase E1 component beta subunit [Neobacillus niacini]